MGKIAIIEDDKPIRDMYIMKFQTAGLEVREAENGKQGLELIEAFKPDLILLDLMMPVMGGQQMLKELREKDWGKDTLVIILTNLSQNEASMNLRLLRVEKYIVKAYNTPKQVLEMVLEVLGRYGKLTPKK